MDAALDPTKEVSNWDVADFAMGLFGIFSVFFSAPIAAAIGLVVLGYFITRLFIGPK